MKTAFMFMRYFQDESRKYEVLKFDDQMKALEHLGYKVFYLGIMKNEVFLCNKEHKKKMKNIHMYNVPILSRIFTYVAIYHSAISACEVVDQIDFVYIRNMFATPSFVKALKVLNEKCKNIVMEIPTYPAEKEEKFDRRIYRKPMYKIMHYMERKASKYVDLYALIGEHSDNYLKTPAINISNGINIENVAMRNPQINRNEIHILCLAKMARWHGYDRLIQGLSRYYEKVDSKNIYIHMVGPEGDGSLIEWQYLTKKLNLEKYVLFEGAKIGTKLDEVVNRCDVACDSLGMYLKNFDITSSLKIREYTARGIPFIITTSDDALDEKAPYWIRLENNKTPIDIAKIIRFVEGTRGMEYLPERMHQYAKENMTWENQFRKILNVLESR